MAEVIRFMIAHLDTLFSNPPLRGAPPDADAPDADAPFGAMPEADAFEVVFADARVEVAPVDRTVFWGGVPQAALVPIVEPTRVVPGVDAAPTETDVEALIPSAEPLMAQAKPDDGADLGMTKVARMPDPVVAPQGPALAVLPAGGPDHPKGAEPVNRAKSGPVDALTDVPLSQVKGLGLSTKDEAPSRTGERAAAATPTPAATPGAEVTAVPTPTPHTTTISGTRLTNLRRPEADWFRPLVPGAAFPQAEPVAPLAMPQDMPPESDIALIDASRPDRITPKEPGRDPVRRIAAASVHQASGTAKAEVSQPTDDAPAVTETAVSAEPAITKSAPPPKASPKAPSAPDPVDALMVRVQTTLPSAISTRFWARAQDAPVPVDPGRDAADLAAPPQPSERATVGAATAPLAAKRSRHADQGPSDAVPVPLDVRHDALPPPGALHDQADPLATLSAIAPGVGRGPDATPPAVGTPPPVTQQIAAPLIASIVQDAGSSGQIEVILSPEELGHVRMDFRADGDRVQVHLVAERPETMDLLRRNAEALVAELRQAGYAGASLNFGHWCQSRDGQRPAILQGHGEPSATSSGGSATLNPPRTAATGGLDLRL